MSYDTDDVLVLVGLSGSGKSHLIERICREAKFERIPSVTTRERREGEAHGVHKVFLSEEEFEARAERGQLICVAENFGAHYGHDARAIRAANGVAVVELAAASLEDFRVTFPNARAVVVSPMDAANAKTSVSRREDDGTDATERLNEEPLCDLPGATTFINRYDAQSETDFVALAKMLFHS